MRLLGDGKDKSILRGAAGAEFSPILTIKANRVEIRGLTVALEPFDPKNIKHTKRVALCSLHGYRSGLRLIDCRIDGGRSLSLQLQGGVSDVLIQDSEIIGNECQMGTANNIRVDRCRFLGRADAGMAMYWLGAWCVSVTRCVAVDADKSAENAWDQFQGRFVACTAYGQRVDNWYLAENETIDMTVRPEYFNQNTGEQFMWESIDAIDESAVASATADSVDLAEPVKGERIPWYANALIISGKGLGQIRQIMDLAADGKRIKLATPWRVVPDSTSVVQICHNIYRVVVYANKLDGKPRAWQSEKHIANAGVEPFGGSHTLIVDSNSFHELRGGIHSFGLADGKRRGVAPTFFNLYANNATEKTRYGFRHWAGEDPANFPRGLHTLGVITRRNTVKTAVEHGIQFGVSG
ncbi:MAG: hypothetical protein N3A66_10910, partial [Planctomycetota bacterium]|nr:hypothetical protein [Planctomycetota bacterium]